MTDRKARMAIFLTVFMDLLGFGIVIPILPLYSEAIAAHGETPWMHAATGWGTRAAD